MKQINYKKSVVWVDVDDVCVMFRTMFNKFLRETYHFKITDDYMAKSWTYEEIIPAGDDFMNYFKSLPVNWTENQVVFPFVKAYLDEIHKMGHYIILITAVPEHAVHYRLKNLISTHQLYFDEIYFTSQSKSLYAQEIIKRFGNSELITNVLIDDRAKNCIDFLNNVPNMEKIISLDAPFNNSEMTSYPASNIISYESNTEEMWNKLMAHLRQ